MANSFSKEERVAFENLLEGFQDALVLSRNVSIYNTDQTMMERTNNVIWRPQPYISTSLSGANAGTNITGVGGYSAYTQLSVPSSINQTRTVAWEMNALELRDALQEQRLGSSAKQKIASDINIAVNNVAANLGSLVVARTTAAGATSGFDDVAQCEAIFNEQGIMDGDRYLALNTRDYNGLAKDLSVASRSFGNQKSDKAYERAYVGMVASFDTYKLDYAPRLTKCTAVGAAINTLAAGPNNYIPSAVTSSPTLTERLNVDNRFQTLTVNTISAGAFKAGDAFTITGVNAVHHITKEDTGQLKTFRVVSIAGAPAGGNQTITITPPIISNNQVATSASAAQYKNCVVTAPVAAAAVVPLNIKDAGVNCFWHKDAIEILPGRYAIPTDGGVAVMRGSTDQGLELVMTKRFDQDSLLTKYRIDTLFGVVNKQPEMSGIILFSQS
jgi:hypothetical protein